MASPSNDTVSGASRLAGAPLAGTRQLISRVLRATSQRVRVPQLLHAPLKPQTVTVLMYHAVVREPLTVRDWCFVQERSFIDQIRYLTRHFEIIRLRDVVERLRTRRIYRPTAAITFDDGYQNNYDIAWPILRDANVPATIFLVTGLLDSEDTVWSCRLQRAIMHTRVKALVWNGARFDLQDAASRARTGSALKRGLKQLPLARLNAEVTGLICALGDHPDSRIERDSPFRMLDRQSVTEMAQSSLIDFGAHTRSHAILARLSNEDCRAEVDASVAAVTAMTGRPCTQFAYPNGRAADYGSAAIAAVTAAGIETAVTTVRRRNDRRTPALELGRHGVGCDMSMDDFRAMLEDGPSARRASR